MSTCDYCGQEFFSGGVTVNGLGTFCGYKCSVLKAHEKAGAQLFYYQCRFCRTVLVTTYKSDRPERCRCSGAWMTRLFSQPVETDEHRALFAQGRVWNPHNPPPPAWLCARCGDEQPGTAVRIRRPDGECCTACQAAEEHPPLLTPDEIAAKQAERAAVRREDEDRMEAAYAAQEKPCQN